uniref:EF-hand domain-containing protein n=1 Tax=Alexandrium monilatum TaxID=311494 RepID=A0A7S4SDL9_9DINO
MAERPYRLPLPVEALQEQFAILHTGVQAAALGSLEVGGAHEVDRETSADTIFAIDKHVDPVIEAFFKKWAQDIPMVVIAEGLDEGGCPGQLGEGVRLFGCDRLADAQMVVIVDPIDGTRGLMYDKRPAWMLCGVARNARWPARLSDIDFAFMGELPTSKQGLVDCWWAGRGRGAHGERRNLYTGASRPLRPAPSSAANFDKGFAMLSKFFPFGKPLLCEVEHKLLDSMGLVSGAAVVFDDQYICTGGQLAELIHGRDRFNADLRCWAYSTLGEPQGLCVHPYDLASVLVAEEAGVIVTDPQGRPLDGPLDCTTGLDWVGYANAQLRELTEPKLQAALAACTGPAAALRLDCGSSDQEALGHAVRAFRKLDASGSGLVKREMLVDAMAHLFTATRPCFTSEDLGTILQAAGIPDDPNIDYMKLLHWIFGK